MADRTYPSWAVYLSRAKSVGIAACIADAGVRDVDTIRELELPVWSAGRTPITLHHRLEAVKINRPVSVAGVTVWPGDMLAADDTGLCVVPQGSAARVLELLCVARRV